MATAPTPTKKANGPLANSEPTLIEQEREELLKIRAGAWESQKSSGKTGTCVFLELLLKVHEALLHLETLEHGNLQTDFTTTEVKALKELTKPISTGNKP